MPKEFPVSCTTLHPVGREQEAVVAYIRVTGRTIAVPRRRSPLIGVLELESIFFAMQHAVGREFLVSGTFPVFRLAEYFK